MTPTAQLGRPGTATRGSGRCTEDGSTLLLTIFYAALALAVVLLVVAASALYLERKRLFTLADGAALVGAEAFQLDQVTVSAGRPEVTLRSADVAAAVGSYLATVPVGDLEGLVVESAGTIDGRSATVSLSSWWRPPVVSLFVPEGIRVEVTAVARSVLR